MNELGPWIDAHSHLADERWGPDLDEAIAEAEKLGIHFFMQGGVGPQDWERQVVLSERYPGKIGLCFGLHPYWVAAHDEDLCEIALDSLAVMLPKAMALGETGLDFRPHIMKDSRERQITMFESQLQLAEAVNLPVVLHLVQAHDEALRIMDLWGLPERRGLVHSFNGSAFQAQEYLKRGLFLSVGGPVARRDNERLRQAVKQAPLEYLLIETDSPDQPPPAYKGQKNPPGGLWEVAKAVAELKGMTPQQIFDITASNFRRLFPS